MRQEIRPRRPDRAERERTAGGKSQRWGERGRNPWDFGIRTRSDGGKDGRLTSTDETDQDQARIPRKRQIRRDGWFNFERNRLTRFEEEPRETKADHEPFIASGALINTRCSLIELPTARRLSGQPGFCAELHIHRSLPAHWQARPLPSICFEGSPRCRDKIHCGERRRKRRANTAEILFGFPHAPDWYTRFRTGIYLDLEGELAVPIRQASSHIVGCPARPPAGDQGEASNSCSHLVDCGV